jgi:energy-converting hydrogenase Eha subunit E
LRLDIRIPIGTLFLVVGALLVVAGCGQGAVTVAGLDAGLVDIGWGLVMGAFGAALVGLALVARRARPAGVGR